MIQGRKDLPIEIENDQINGVFGLFDSIMNVQNNNILLFMFNMYTNPS